MKLTESDSIRLISGIGEVAETALGKLGIATVGDLLRYYPRQYLDLTKTKTLHQATFGELTVFKLTVMQVVQLRTKTRGVMMFQATCQDSDGTKVLARWFHQPYLRTKLLPGTQWLMLGNLSKFNKDYVLMAPLLETEEQVLAVYGLTKGVTSKMLRGWVKTALSSTEIVSDIPIDLMKTEAGMVRSEALVTLHRPTTIENVEAARSAMAFEESFWFFVRMYLQQQAVSAEAGITLKFDEEWFRGVVSSLPFKLTNGQKVAVWDGIKDTSSGRVMTRLLNGDVGSGKTVVAGLLAAQTAKNGYSSILLAPTDILARQHTESLRKLVGESGRLSIGLYTAAHKDEVSSVDIVVGTHAVLTPDFLKSIKNLGLVVIDEQHRFGVKQRQLLRKVSGSTPHVLSMTATPIPRTLALALYGDLKVSLLKDRPKGRKEIETTLVLPSQRNFMYERLASEIGAGKQVFVICPLIREKPGKDEDLGQTIILTDEEVATEERKTVEAEVVRLRAEFPHFGRIEAIHGKVKPKEKARIMEEMASGAISVLVATSVIEVGVDVPGATVIVIEAAERFGLAQLHQLRGRVGRNSDQSYCFLCPEKATDQALERLEVLVEYSSGFDVAERDLELRGPGELIGNLQSGLPDFKMVSITDTEYLLHVREVAEEYLRTHPEFAAECEKRTYYERTSSLE